MALGPSSKTLWDSNPQPLNTCLYRSAGSTAGLSPTPRLLGIDWMYQVHAEALWILRLIYRYDVYKPFIRSASGTLATSKYICGLNSYVSFPQHAALWEALCSQISSFVASRGCSFEPLTHQLLSSRPTPIASGVILTINENYNDRTLARNSPVILSCEMTKAVVQYRYSGKHSAKKLHWLSSIQKVKICSSLALVCQNGLSPEELGQMDFFLQMLST